MAIKQEKTKITKAEKPQKSESTKANRPASHGKKVAPGKVTVTRGTEKPKAAQRGVGQETIDGFINNRTRKKRRG